MKSIGELERIRREAMTGIGPRVARTRVTFVVHMGTDGLAAGARDVMMAILDELRRQGLTDCLVTQTDVTGLHAKPPVVDLLIPGHASLTYTRVTPEDARRIVVRHLVAARAAVGQ
ncbi:MAG: (2Fe-2S) ferredoxin domain-containing protein [Firmicutes bacterium]|nr:(2Fe-2S) ferredoxin domain-containing protein [Bacillota bacterium]